MQMLLTPTQVHKLLNVSKPTVYRLAMEGILPSVVIASRRRKKIIRFREETVERFIKDREARA